jgi:hypothetical protein
MILKFRLYTTAAVLAFVSFAFSASAQTTETTTTVFPPQNQAAGQGLLYFPAGGTGSLYAVPVQEDPNLVGAVNNQTTAVVAALNNLGIANNQTSGLFQTNCLQSPSSSGSLPAGCYITNTKTGVIYYNQLQLVGGKSMYSWVQVTNEPPATAGNVCSAIPSGGNSSSPLINYITGQTYSGTEQIMEPNPSFSNLPGSSGYSQPAWLQQNIPSGCSWTCSSKGWSSAPTSIAYYAGQTYTSNVGPVQITQAECMTPTGGYYSVGSGATGSNN